MKSRSKIRRHLLLESSIIHTNLGDIAELRVGMSPQRADFYILAHDYMENVGKPVSEYSENRIGVRIKSNIVNPEDVRRNLDGLYRSGYYNNFEPTMIRADFYATDDRRVRLDPVVLQYTPVRLETQVVEKGVAGATSAMKAKLK